MKVTIGSYEVDLKVKGIYNSSKYNDADLGSLLNLLSIVFEESANWNEQQFHRECNYRRQPAKELYKFCRDELKIYDRD